MQAADLQRIMCPWRPVVAQHVTMAGIFFLQGRGFGQQHNAFANGVDRALLECGFVLQRRDVGSDSLI